jgi:CRP-like cAMP-binding protein
VLRLRRIAPGLKLYEDGDRSAVEYFIENGRIEILTLDKNNVEE